MHIILYSGHWVSEKSFYFFFCKNGCKLSKNDIVGRLEACFQGVPLVYKFENVLCIIVKHQ